MRIAGRVDQLTGDAHSVAGFAHRAFEDISDAKLAPDLLHIDRLALVRKTRIAGDDKQPADARQRSDDLLDHPVDEIFLLRVAAHIGEGQYSDRRLVGEGNRRLSRRRWALRRGAGVANPVDPDRPGNVFDLLLAQILEGKGQPIAHVVVDRIGDEHPAGIGQGFDPCGDVDAVAIEIVALDDHIAEIDADAKLDAPIGGNLGIALGHRALHLDRAAHRVDDAGKLDQHAVAGGLDDAAVMRGNFRIGDRAPQLGQRGVRALLVRAHQPRIPGHIGGEDRGETAGSGHV
jgi:hypothetical protein